MVVSANLLPELFHEMWALGTRSHDAHVALQNINELRQLIQARLSQQGPEPRPSRVYLSRPAGVAFGYGQSTECGTTFTGLPV